MVSEVTDKYRTEFNVPRHMEPSSQCHHPHAHPRTLKSSAVMKTFRPLIFPHPVTEFLWKLKKEKI